MSTPQNPINLFSPFLPSTFNMPEEDDRLREWLGAKFSQITDVVNDKMIGAYTQDAQSFSGGKFIYDTTRKVRNGFRSILRIPSFVSGTYALPVNTFNEQTIISLVYGSASKPCSAVGANDGDYFSFFSEGNTNIQFTMSDTEIILTATPGMVDYSGFIVIEYIPDGI